MLLLLMLVLVMHEHLEPVALTTGARNNALCMKGTMGVVIVDSYDEH